MYSKLAAQNSLYCMKLMFLTK